MMHLINNKQLIEAAHLAAKYLPPASAQLMVELANSLDVQSEQVKQLAAENAALLTPEKWLMHSEAGDAAAAVAEGNGASEEEVLMAGMKAIISCMETPATDAFLSRLRNEERAEGVEMLLASLPAHYTARFDIEKFAEVLREGKAGEVQS